MATSESVTYGRDQAEWDLLTRVGEQFLIERARLGRLTSYTGLNVPLERLAGLRPVDFGMQPRRAAMDSLFGLIVRERNRPVTHLMISALVIYLHDNVAGSGFDKLAHDLETFHPARCLHR